MNEAEVAEQCVTKQGITLNVRSVIAFKVGNDEESIINAGQRSCPTRTRCPRYTGRIFAGTALIIGSMTVEEIVHRAPEAGQWVLDGSKAEDGQDRLTVDSLQIQAIDRPELRLHRRDGRRTRPRSSARRRSPGPGQPGRAQAEQESQRKQAEYARQTGRGPGPVQAENR